MKKQDDFTFNGFEPANTTPVPDVLFDELLSQLTGAELKVLLYIIRRTKGFKKDTDAISLSQFQKGILTRDGRQLDKGCGIGDRQTIIDALSSLEKKKCIISEKGKTSIGDNATTTYRIYFSQGVVGKTNHLVGKTNHGSMENPTTVVDFSNHGSSENQLPVVGNSNPQETVLQDTELQERVIPEESNSAHTDTDTFAPSLPLGALSLSNNDNHSQSLPLSSTVTTRNEEGDTHAQPLQPLPTANHPDRGSGDVPSRDSQVNSTGFTSPLDAAPVGSAAGSDADGGEGRAGVGEDTARGIGSRSPGEADTTRDTARGQVTEGEPHDLVGMDVPGHPHRVGNVAAPGGDTHHAPMDDRHVATPEVGPVLEAGQEEIDTLGRAWQHVDDEQTASREDASVVAASPLDTSTVEPRESGEDTLPGAPVTEQPAQGQEGKRTGKRSRPPEKPKEVKPEPTADEIALQERCRRLYNRIVEWRGYAFDLKGAIINERTYVKRLAMKYASDELIEQIYVHLTTKDFKWSKPSFRFKVGAYELFTEAPSVIQQMKLNGTVDSDGAPHDANMIEWKGQWMSKEEAYQQGYLGGWERYKGQLLPDGRHPLDDELPMQGVK